MSLPAIILTLVVLGAFGGTYYGGPAYYTSGFTLGGILLLAFIALLVTRRL